MKFWKTWYNQVNRLKSSCSYCTTYLWLCTILFAFSIRIDQAGVTSFIRSLAIKPIYYHCVLHFFHSNALNIYRLTMLWINLCISIFNKFSLKVDGKVVLAADGLKAPKEGRRMPGVKLLHQESNNNCKAEYILGHYIESLAMIVGNELKTFAVPLLGRIHGGILFNKDDKKLTLIDRFINLLMSFFREISYYLIADAYYIAKKLMKYLVSEGNHLVTRMRSNAVAWEEYSGPIEKSKRGRPRIYGKKVHIRDLFRDLSLFKKTYSPVYGEKKVKIKYLSRVLILRPKALQVQIVLVVHPHRGKIILVTTDVDLSPLTVIKLYGVRFKIEVTFKTAKHLFGTFSYHFWMKKMKKISRNTGDQNLSGKSKTYKKQVERKIRAYNVFIQIGYIAQGLLQYLSIRYPILIWNKYGSWMRTMNRAAPPSEGVVSNVLRDNLKDFLKNLSPREKIKKFLCWRINFSRLTH